FIIKIIITINLSIKFYFIFFENCFDKILKTTEDFVFRFASVELSRQISKNYNEFASLKYFLVVKIDLEKSRKTCLFLV
ncbi:hypothetical protein R7J43_20660, partial [Acinetobacter baumannii]|nr:hypothetical protein [Acinetobacter baumannii]